MATAYQENGGLIYIYWDQAVSANASFDIMFHLEWNLNEMNDNTIWI